MSPPQSRACGKPEEHKERIFRLMVAEDEVGKFLGFNWATRSRFDPNEAYIYVIVKPEKRGKGIGSRLYQDVEQSAGTTQREGIGSHHSR